MSEPTVKQPSAVRLKIAFMDAAEEALAQLRPIVSRMRNPPSAIDREDVSFYLTDPEVINWYVMHSCYDGYTGDLDSNHIDEALTDAGVPQTWEF